LIGERVAGSLLPICGVARSYAIAARSVDSSRERAARRISPKNDLATRGALLWNGKLRTGNNYDAELLTTFAL
jgi:hypothetical protein